jgi:hypothetical protein
MQNENIKVMKYSDEEPNRNLFAFFACLRRSGYAPAGVFACQPPLLKS